MIVSSSTSNFSLSSETKSQLQWKLQGRKEQGFIFQSNNGICSLQGVSRLAWEAVIRFGLGTGSGTFVWLPLLKSCLRILCSSFHPPQGRKAMCQDVPARPKSSVSRSQLTPLFNRSGGPDRPVSSSLGKS